MTLDKDHPIESADLDAHMATAVNSIRILTVNTHKGFTALNRRFILPELREAVRSVSADVVFLQEVLGTHDKHAMRFHNWPATPQYEFLADSIWTDFAYGRNAVYPDGDHGNGGGMLAEPIESHGEKVSLTLTLPPLGLLVLRPQA